MGKTYRNRLDRSLAFILVSVAFPGQVMDFPWLLVSDAFLEKSRTFSRKKLSALLMSEATQITCRGGLKF